MQPTKKGVLQAPFQELLLIQNQLCQRSNYFGFLLQNRLGTDTIPFALITYSGEPLCVNNKRFFRLETVDDKEISLMLLEAYTADNLETTSAKNAVYLVKTEQIVRVSLKVVAGIQLSHLPLQGPNFFESKW